MGKSKWQEIKGYFRQWPAQGWGWRWRNFINLVDDPVDNLKHWLHGRRVLGLTIRLPAWLMRGSGKPGK